MNMQTLWILGFDYNVCQVFSKVLWFHETLIDYCQLESYTKAMKVTFRHIISELVSAEG